MTIEPDTKDWTWVLERPCPECGFDPADHPATGVAVEVRANARRWVELLADPRARTRPQPDVWSALEYGAHVRDVFAIGVYRNGLMLAEDDPTFPNWDQDVTAIEEDYASQDPSVVADQVVAAAEDLANLIDGVEGEQWDRSGLRSDGSRFTVASFSVYVLHDPEHHVWDVEQGYARLA